MASVVGQIDRVVGTHVDAMRPRVLSLAPGAEEITVAVEHHHRMVAAVEDVDVVVPVDADRADLLERPAVGQLRPVLDNAIPVVPGPDDDRHANAPDWCWRREPNPMRHSREGGNPGSQ